MRNLKRVLALVVVFATILSTVAFAAPTDVAGTKYEDAVGRLAALDILAGFPDGTFKPEDKVTRAQMAKIICNSLGIGSAAQYAVGDTMFTDVAANHWAAGYIKVAADIGIINGMGDGTFAPDAEVTYAQAIKMIVAALGYEPKATALGGYPGGYLAIAAEKKITKDVNVVSSLSASRGDIALMVDKSLTVPMMYQKTWGQFPEFADDDDSKTLLTQKLGYRELDKAVVTAVPAYDDSLKKNEIKLGGTTYKVFGNQNVNDYFGLEVVAWADEKEDEIFYITVKTDDKDVTNGFITQYHKDGKIEVKGTAKATIVKDATIYVNGEAVSLNEFHENFIDSKGGINTNSSLYQVGRIYGRIVYKDGEIIFMNLFNLKDAYIGVVDTIDSKGKEIEYISNKANSDKREELDLSDYENVYVFDKNLSLISADQIEKDSVITYFDLGENLYILYSQPNIVTGVVTSHKGDAVKIGGKTYNQARLYGTVSFDSGDNFQSGWGNNLDDIIDENVTLYLDLEGRGVLIVSETEATSDVVYGIVTDAEISGKNGTLTVFTKNGEEVDYKVETRSMVTPYNFSSEALNYYGKVSNGDLRYAVVGFKLNSKGEIDELKSIDNYSGIVGYTIKNYLDDNKKNTIEVTPEFAEPGNSSNLRAFSGYLNKKEDKKSFTVDGKTFDVGSKTIIMKAVDKNDQDLDPEILEPSRIIDININDAPAIVYGQPGRSAEFIVFLDKDFEGSKEDIYFGATTSAPWKTGDDWITTIDVYGEGTKEYVIADGNDKNFKNHSVVAFRINNRGEAVYVNGYQCAAGATDSAVNNADVLLNSGVAKRDGDIVTGIVYDVDGDYIKVWLEGTYKSGGKTITISEFCTPSVASDALVYELTLNATNEKFGAKTASRASRISENDNVIFMLNEDNEVVVAFFKPRKSINKL